MMLSITLPAVFIELPLDMALHDARASLAAHEDNTGELNPYTVAAIARLEAIEARMIENPTGRITLDPEDISTITVFASEWKCGQDIDRITVDMLDR
jgi:hypothetical protein